MTALLEITSVLEKMESSLSVYVETTTSIVVAGNPGSSNRMNYSVIGDTVNRSARLESLMRLYNASNIGSEASMDDAPNLPIASSASSALLVSRSGFASSNY